MTTPTPSKTPSVESSLEQKGTVARITTIFEQAGPKNHGSAEVWAAGASAGMYEPIPEYEGRHRYDPTAEWTEGEEKRLVRRVCFYTIASWVGASLYANPIVEF